MYRMMIKRRTGVERRVAKEGATDKMVAERTDRQRRVIG